MAQTVYVIDCSPKARNLIFGKPALEQFRLYFLEVVNQQVVDNRGTSMSLIALTHMATLACPLIDKRFPLQEAARNLRFSEQLGNTEVTQNSLFDSLKLGQMALNYRVNKETTPQVQILIASQIDFDESTLEKECKAIRKNGLHCDFWLAGAAYEYFEIYNRIAEFITNSKVVRVDNETQLMAQSEEMDEELKYAMELSRQEYLMQQLNRK